MPYCNRSINILFLRSWYDIFNIHIYNKMLNILYNDPKNTRMLLYRMLSISYHDFMNKMLIGRFFLDEESSSLVFYWIKGNGVH